MQLNEVMSGCFETVVNRTMSDEERKINMRSSYDEWDRMLEEGRERIGNQGENTLLVG